MLDFWQSNGGLMRFGFPITPARDEPNPDAGMPLLTQWFERNRLELHVGNAEPYQLQLGRLGDESMKTIMPLPGGDKVAAQPKDGCRWFPETRHNVCDQAPGSGFRSYWQMHGVEVDGMPGVGFADSLALFGFPLSEAAQATNSSGDTVITQWFERARFEWHSENRVPHRVLLGRLGAEFLGTTQAGSSGIAGVIQAGPICPIVRQGMECPDKPLQATVRVEDAANGQIVAEFTSDHDGRFHVPLAPGRYRIVPLTPNGGAFPRGVPIEVDVPAGNFVLVVIRYDTGIR
jgi:hypothetical protein